MKVRAINAIGGVLRSTGVSSSGQAKSAASANQVNRPEHDLSQSIYGLSNSRASGNGDVFRQSAILLAPKLLTSTVAGTVPGKTS